MAVIDKGKILLPIARASIAEVLGINRQIDATLLDENAGWLQDKAACFVTLTRQGELRGCIGTLEAHRSLLDDVRANARSAAFHDPRFAPLKTKELDHIDIEVSLLSVAQPLLFDDEQDALRQLQPGIDGLVFEFGRYRSTFLPQVWQQLPDSREFMAQLKRKAGLSSDFWSDQVRLQRYSVSKWKERDVEELTA